MSPRAAAFVLSFALLVRSAWADPPELPPEAHMTEALRAYQLGQFAEAAAHYRKTYERTHDPAFLYDVGQCERLAGHAPEASAALRDYLAATPNSPYRPQVEEQLRRLAAQPPIPPAPPSSIVVSPPLIDGPPVRAAVSVPALSDAAPVRARPLYRRWWLWTAVVGVAVGVSLGVGLGLGLAPHGERTHFGTQEVF